jgi:hypothetical protein
VENLSGILEILELVLELVWNFQHLIINILTKKMELNVELVWEVLGGCGVGFSGEVKNI